ncbi:MAG: hypothetical protein A3E00_06320 [Curvibacter sp. RIFCSPHIGHO2_12_FULL_63_18]|nr:MAG: hypothetical protein A2037_01135 [Curvibacter sp. GWA2_63_95]OGO98744.1 MAG: hypothetical protein A3E00_06320 [Curvibacter sp. RIFCSPHIGHO2_12_FULL_63_18]
MTGQHHRPDDGEPMQSLILCCSQDIEQSFRSGFTAFFTYGTQHRLHIIARWSDVAVFTQEFEIGKPGRANVVLILG